MRFLFRLSQTKYNICKSLIFFGIFFSNLHTCSLFLSLPLSKSLSTILHTNWQALGRWPDFPVTTIVSSSSYFPSNSYKKKKINGIFSFVSHSQNLVKFFVCLIILFHRTNKIRLLENYLFYLSWSRWKRTRKLCFFPQWRLW